MKDSYGWIWAALVVVAVSTVLVGSHFTVIPDWIIILLGISIISSAFFMAMLIIKVKEK